MPYGISPTQECFVPLPSGNFFVFPSVQAAPDGVDYVRIVNANGGELVYWVSDEWAEEPIEVMGAICGAMLGEPVAGYADEQAMPCKPHYYQFAADCEFPPDIEFTPYGAD